MKAIQRRFRSAARWARVLVVLASLTVAGGCNRGGGSAAPALLVETADPVTVNGKAVHVLPSAPLSLAAGDLLEAGPKGLARLLYPDGSRFLLMPRGNDSGSLEVTPRALSAAPVVVKLVRGVLAFLVPKDRTVKDKYELRALNTVTTVEGTAGRIFSSATEDRVALEHGSVSVAAGAAVTRINGLQEAVWTRAANLFSVLTYDPNARDEAVYYAAPGFVPVEQNF